MDCGERKGLVLLAVVETVSGFDEPSSVLVVMVKDLDVQAA